MMIVMQLMEALAYSSAGFLLGLMTTRTTRNLRDAT